MDKKMYKEEGCKNCIYYEKKEKFEEVQIFFVHEFVNQYKNVHNVLQI